MNPPVLPSRPLRLSKALSVLSVLSVAAAFGAAACCASSATAQTAPRQDATRSTQPRAQMSEGERRMRMMLLQRSMGFGGIFGPMIAPLNRPSAAPAQKSCSAYSDYAACQAYRNGDQWAADRLQRQDSTPAERDWYSH